MRFIRAHRLEIGILVLFTALFFLTRLYNLTQLPIFTDEAIYLRWAQIAKNDASWRFISLTDGKQPLFIWFVIPMLKVFQDPLMAGRFVSVGAGFLSMIGLFFLGKEIFRSKVVGLFSAGLYVVYPMALVYDRMALYDTLVGTFTIWALYLEVLLVKRIRLDIALILSFVLGGAMLTKTNGFFSAAFLPFTLLLFDWTQKDRVKKLFRWGMYAALSFIIAYIYYSALRLSPFFHIIDEKNATFVYPLAEWLANPFLGFWGKITFLSSWFITYLTIPITLLIFLAFLIQRFFFREKVLLLLLFLIPFVYLSFFGRVIYPRYIFPMTLPLLLLAALTLSIVFQKSKNIYVFLVFVFVATVLALRADYLILTDMAKAPIPESDQYQYITGWPAGVGVKEAVNFFEEKARVEKIQVITEGTFGLLPYALELYLIDNPNVKITGLWPIKDILPLDIALKSEKIPTYVVFYQPCPGCKKTGEPPPLWPVKEVLRVQKANDTSFTVYQVTVK